MVSVQAGPPAVVFNEGVLPFWIHESLSIKAKMAGQCGESIKSLLSAGVLDSNSSRVTAWLNSHTPAKSPIRHNRFMWRWSIVLHLPRKRERGYCFSKTNQTLMHCVAKRIHPFRSASLEQGGLAFYTSCGPMFRHLTYSLQIPV